MATSIAGTVNNPSGANIRLFYGSCLALITTAFSASIRAGVLPQIGREYNISAQDLGFLTSMWFYGFTITMVVGGLVYNYIGPKIIMQFAFVAHTLGILLTIFATSYNVLLISTLFIGLGNGCTEAACNPLIATSYSGKQMNTLMNRFHMWFPGGILVGSLISFLMTRYMPEVGWRGQMWVLMLPTIAYLITFWGQTFPASGADVVRQRSGGVKIGSWIGLFIFICVCMSLTAISEFGPGQWAGVILASSGAEPMIITALTAGVAAFGRYFGGEFVHKFDQTGVLLVSAILTAIGIFLLSISTGPMAYVAAFVFGMGYCYFWPNMLGFTAEKIPASGALGMSIVGAVGMFATATWSPIIGIWIDNARAKAAADGLTGEVADLAAGQSALTYMISFPVILVVLFTILYFWMKKRNTAVAS